MRMQRDKRGFTLIELLVVVAIISLLATIAMPNLMDKLRKAKMVKVQADIKQIETALIGYYDKHGSFKKLIEIQNDVLLNLERLSASASFAIGDVYKDVLFQGLDLGYIDDKTLFTEALKNVGQDMAKELKKDGAFPKGLPLDPWKSRYVILFPSDQKGRIPIGIEYDGADNIATYWSKVPPTGVYRYIHVMQEPFDVDMDVLDVGQLNLEASPLNRVEYPAHLIANAVKGFDRSTNEDVFYDHNSAFGYQEMMKAFLAPKKVKFYIFSLGEDGQPGQGNWQPEDINDPVNLVRTEIGCFDDVVSWDSTHGYKNEYE